MTEPLDLSARLAGLPDGQFTFDFTASATHPFGPDVTVSGDTWTYQLPPDQPFVMRLPSRRRWPLWEVIEYRRDRDSPAVTRTVIRRWWWWSGAIVGHWLERAAAAREAA